MPMTKEEFKKKFEEFWDWVGPNKVAESSYWLSVEEYASKKFNKCYEAEEAQKEKK